MISMINLSLGKSSLPQLSTHSLLQCFSHCRVVSWLIYLKKKKLQEGCIFFTDESPVIAQWLAYHQHSTICKIECNLYIYLYVYI